jgi:hypothetical protein
VKSGGKVLLAAEVGIVAPKTTEGEAIACPYNQVEKVTVDITELLAVDCPSGTDCIVIVEMIDPDGAGVYTYGVPPVTAPPGKYALPVWAVDTLGHEDKKEILVWMLGEFTCVSDADHDGDVDGADLALLANDFGREDCEVPPVCEADLDGDNIVEGRDLERLVWEFGRDHCTP